MYEASKALAAVPEELAKIYGKVKSAQVTKITDLAAIFKKIPSTRTDAKSLLKMVNRDGELVRVIRDSTKIENVLGKTKPVLDLKKSVDGLVVATSLKDGIQNSVKPILFKGAKYVGPITKGIDVGISLNGISNSSNPGKDTSEFFGEQVGAWAGAWAGASGGAAWGTLIGGPAGAIVGGIVGSIGGGIAGSDIGKQIGDIVYKNEKVKEGADKLGVIIKDGVNKVKHGAEDTFNSVKGGLTSKFNQVKNKLK